MASGMNDLVNIRLNTLQEGHASLFRRFKVNEDIDYMSFMKSKRNRHNLPQIVESVRIFGCNVFGDPASGQPMNLISKTFRLSNYTTVEQLHRTACSYWGLIQREFGLYYINEKDQPVNITRGQDEKTFCTWLG